MTLFQSWYKCYNLTPTTHSQLKTQTRDMRILSSKPRRDWCEQQKLMNTIVKQISQRESSFAQVYGPCKLHKETAPIVYLAGSTTNPLPKWHFLIFQQHLNAGSNVLFRFISMTKLNLTKWWWCYFGLTSKLSDLSKLKQKMEINMNSFVVK